MQIIDSQNVMPYNNRADGNNIKLHSKKANSISWNYVRDYKTC